MKAEQLRGIIGYLITPLTSDDRVDVARLERLTKKMIADGVHAISPLGSAGLLPYLDAADRERVLETVCRQAKDRVPVLVGISSLTTRDAVFNAKAAAAAGASALLLAPTAYWKLTEREIVGHYTKVAEATALPIMVYNNPASGTDMAPDLILRLAEIPNITMVKESTGDLSRIQHLLTHNKGQLRVYVGKNTLSFPALALGCHGWCSAAAHIIPKEIIELYELCQTESDLKAAQSLFARISPLLHALVSGGLPRSVAAALEILGEDPIFLRAPMLPLPDSGRKELHVLLRELGRV